MAKYRKKPIVIEAVKFNGINVDDVKDFTNGLAKLGYSRFPTEENGYAPLYVEIVIPTLEGDMVAKIGDYIIKGVNGEFYPCKPDIFEKTYEEF